MNSSTDEIEVFRQQVELIDMIGCEDMNEIISKIKALSARGKGPFFQEKYQGPAIVPDIVKAEGPPGHAVRLDKAGYFVILPRKDAQDIVVEYYGYDNRLLKQLQGENARDLYSAIIAGGLITELSHAAYLGKELEKAELSLKYGFKYIQDGA